MPTKKTAEKKINLPDRLQQKCFSRFREPLTPLPDLVKPQRNSFDWLLKEGLKEIFREFSPINDYSEKKFESY